MKRKYSQSSNERKLGNLKTNILDEIEERFESSANPSSYPNVENIYIPLRSFIATNPEFKSFDVPNDHSQYKNIVYLGETVRENRHLDEIWRTDVNDIIIFYRHVKNIYLIDDNVYDTIQTSSLTDASDLARRIRHCVTTDPRFRQYIVPQSDKRYFYPYFLPFKEENLRRRLDGIWTTKINAHLQAIAPYTAAAAIPGGGYRHQHHGALRGTGSCSRHYSHQRTRSRQTPPSCAPTRRRPRARRRNRGS